MDAKFQEQWMAATAPALGREEAEACLRTYALWLKDRNLPFTANEIKSVTDRLINHEPIQYILGEAWFYGIALQVNRHTLIPRPETEELCEMIINSTAGKNLNILDVGTGSGCIPIALLKLKPDWKATALDIDQDALAIAALNANAQDIAERIIFGQADFTLGFSSQEKWNLIVSNPPYIDLAEKANMERNVLDWEPHTALFPKGQDPLIFYKKLAELLFDQNMGCELWAEINSALAEETLLIFNPFSKKELIKDMSGKFRFLHVVK